jgi:hypothetical protein
MIEMSQHFLPLRFIVAADLSAALNLRQINQPLQVQK